MAATSWGISVICTRCATIQPSTPPAAMSTSESSHSPEPGPSSVAPTASAMPKMPYQTARLALSCPERPPRLRMKRMAATT